MCCVSPCAQGPFVKGGVKISHTLLDGQHGYTGEGVSTHSGGGAPFAR